MSKRWTKTAFQPESVIAETLVLQPFLINFDCIWSILVKCSGFSSLTGALYLQHSTERDGDYVNMAIDSVPVDETTMQFVWEGDYVSMDWHRIVFSNTVPTTGTIEAILTTTLKRQSNP
jgi:hypothetical protein